MSAINPFWYEPVGSSLTLFHGTWSESLPSICKNGLIGYRGRDWAIKTINNTLALFNLTRKDVPSWVYESEIFDRSTRFERLWFTTSYSYAWIHCWAGFELEHQIIINVLGWLQEGSKLNRELIINFIATVLHSGQPAVLQWEVPYEVMSQSDLPKVIRKYQELSKDKTDDPDIAVAVMARIPPIYLKKIYWIDLKKYLHYKSQTKLTKSIISSSTERTEDVFCPGGRIPELPVPVGPRASWKVKWRLP